MTQRAMHVSLCAAAIMLSDSVTAGACIAVCDSVTIAVSAIPSLLSDSVWIHSQRAGACIAVIQSQRAGACVAV